MLYEPFEINSNTNSSFRVSANDNEVATVEEQSSGEIVIKKEVIPPPVAKPTPVPVTSSQSTNSQPSRVINLPPPLSETSQTIVKTSESTESTNNSYLPIILAIFGVLIILFILYLFIFKKKRVELNDTEE